MITKQQARSAKKLKNIKKQRGKYPLLLEQVIEISDIVLEILDARFPKEMQNKEIEKLVKDKGKKIIYVLNKSDLTQKQNQNLKPRVFVSCKNKKGIPELRNKIKAEAAKMTPKGVPPKFEVGGNIIEIVSGYKIRNKNKVKTDLRFEEKVALVKVYPGQEPDILDYYLKKKYKAIVLEMCGLGHAPTKRARKSWVKKLKQVQDKGLIVCACAQTIYGRLDPLVYSNGRELMKTGIIYLEDMLSETALVKLSWVLGHVEWAKNKKIVKEICFHYRTQ